MCSVRGQPELPARWAPGRVEQNQWEFTAHRGSPGDRSHPQFAGPERRGQRGACLVAGQMLQTPAGRDRGERQGGPGYGEGVADALARSRLERDEGVAAWLGPIGVPAIGIVGFGLVVEVWAVVDDVRAVDDGGTGGKQLPAETSVLGDRPGEELDD